VSRDEWIESFISQFGASSDQALAAFRYLDSSGSGEISMDQLKRVFNTMDSDGIGHRYHQHHHHHHHLFSDDETHFFQRTIE